MDAVCSVGTFEFVRLALARIAICLVAPIGAIFLTVAQEILVHTLSIVTCP